MPRDNSIQSILIIGSGPIIIGQACEFDYSGSQAARSLREEGIIVTLLNSNPATIMTDPVVADHVYLLPITIDSVVKILEEQRLMLCCLPWVDKQRLIFAWKPTKWAFGNALGKSYRSRF